jgi:hypothetical protein
MCTHAPRTHAPHIALMCLIPDPPHNRHRHIAHNPHPLSQIKLPPHTHTHTHARIHRPPGLPISPASLQVLAFPSALPSALPSGLVGMGSRGCLPTSTGFPPPGGSLGMGSRGPACGPLAHAPIPAAAMVAAHRLRISAARASQGPFERRARQPGPVRADTQLAKSSKAHFFSRRPSVPKPPPRVRPAPPRVRPDPPDPPDTLAVPTRGFRSERGVELRQELVLVV